LENVGSLTSHSLIGFAGLLRGSFAVYYKGTVHYNIVIMVFVLGKVFNAVIQAIFAAK
jgi:hypothetical protein